jgi:hypothetical protein
MWTGSMPASPECLEIEIKLKKITDIGGIKIWNYNKSLIETTKGIKELEIL